MDGHTYPELRDHLRSTMRKLAREAPGDAFAAFGGKPSSIYGARALEALDQFEEEAKPGAVAGVK